MVATPNKFLEQPARGSLVGVWDTPVNNNSGIIDNSFGGMATIALTNSPVILSSAQYQCAFITFTGALSATCAITFPNVGSWYTVQNLTSNTSTFQVTLQTTVAGAQAIGCPWAESFDIMTDTSGNVKFRNLGRIGSYFEYGGSSVPAWVTACTIPPYLNCDGTTFSSATYPVLATIYGSVTLPDSRGRSRYSLNQGTGRIISSGGAGIDGDTNRAGGGNQYLAQSQLPNVNFTVTDPGHDHATEGFQSVSIQGPLVPLRVGSGSNSALTATNTTGITVASGGSGLPMPSPGWVGGITMVRAG